MCDKQEPEPLFENQNRNQFLIGAKPETEPKFLEVPDPDYNLKMLLVTHVTPLKLLLKMLYFFVDCRSRRRAGLPRRHRQDAPLPRPPEDQELPEALARA